VEIQQEILDMVYETWLTNRIKSAVWKRWIFGLR